MRYTTKTEYGLMCMIYMARHGHTNTLFTIKELAAHENYPLPYIEKIVQALRQAGLVVSRQGNHGGYALAHPAMEISVKQIIEALEGSTFEAFCEPQVREDIICTHICMCGAKPVWKRTKELLDDFYGSITLDLLAKNQIDVQSRLIDISGKG